jgi:NADH-quinone oxidoreductase subunit I
MEVYMETDVDVIKTHRIPERGFVGGILHGLKSLLKGMKVTFHYLSHPSTVVTQQYPENRETLKMFDRSRIQLTMPHDENGWHKCTACTICEQACPNGSIKIISQKGAITGKTEIDQYVWRMDTCTFCNLCVMSCPHDAITMSDAFEASVYDRRLLVYTLNRYAGPTASVLAKVEDPEERKKMMEPRDPYGGEVPLNGFSVAGLNAEDFKAAIKAATENSSSKEEEK